MLNRFQKSDVEEIQNKAWKIRNILHETRGHLTAEAYSCLCFNVDDILMKSSYILEYENAEQRKH